MKMRRRYRVSITKGGYAYILLTIVVSVGAVNTGNNLLYLVSSLMLSAMLLSGMASLFNLAGIVPSFNLPGEVFAGVPVPVEVSLFRKRWLMPSVLVRVEMMGEGAKVALLPCGVDSRMVLWPAFKDRGLHRVSEVMLSSGFPFGFFVRTRYLPVDFKVLVFPHPIASPLDRGRGMWGEGGSATSRGGGGDEVFELRPYREGDSPRHIDWKATARKGDTVVREMCGTLGGVVEVRLVPPFTEDALCRATYQVVEGMRRGLKVGLVLGDEVFAPGSGPIHRRALLEALALA